MWTKAHIPGRQVREARSWDEDPADTGRKLDGQSQAALSWTSTHSFQTQALHGLCPLVLCNYSSAHKVENPLRKLREEKVLLQHSTYIISKNKPKSCDLKIIYKPLQDSWAAGSRVGASNLEFVTRAWKKTHVSRGNTSDLPTKAETCHRGCLTIYKRTRRDDGRFQRVMNKVGGSKLCISGSATHVARRS